MCSVCKHPSQSHRVLLFHMSPCVFGHGSRKQCIKEKKKKTHNTPDGCTVGWWTGRNTPYIQPLWRKLNINISVSESITSGWKWVLRKTCLIPSQTVFDGLIKSSLPDSMTSIFEELMYTGRVAKVSRLVTPELHIHYMHNWNWIWLNFH